MKQHNIGIELENLIPDAFKLGVKYPDLYMKYNQQKNRLLCSSQTIQEQDRMAKIAPRLKPAAAPIMYLSPLLLPSPLIPTSQISFNLQTSDDHFSLGQMMDLGISTTIFNETEGYPKLEQMKINSEGEKDQELSKNSSQIEYEFPYITVLEFMKKPEYNQGKQDSS